MADIGAIITDAIEDVTSLEVATLHGGDIALSDGTDQAQAKLLEERITAQKKVVNDKQIAWLDEQDADKKKAAKKAYKNARKELNELQRQLANVSPRTIFGKISNALGENANVVGYSRFELDGDSVNFLNSELSADKKFLLDAHAENVKAAQEARKNLIDAALSLIPGKKNN